MLESGPAAAATGTMTEGAKRNLGDDGKEEAMPRPPKAVRLTIQEPLAGMVLPVTCEEEEPELDHAEFGGDYADEITGLSPSASRRLRGRWWQSSRSARSMKLPRR